MKIGLIGVGNIGFHFANRLIAAGYELYIYDKSHKALERLSQSGAKICASVKDLASSRTYSSSSSRLTMKTYYYNC